MSLQSDPLAAYYDDEPDQNDPLASYYENAEPSYENPVDRELQSLGYEPDITEEFERMYELGDREAGKGLLAGATLGLSKLVPGLKPGDNIAAQGGELIGSFIPIGAVHKIASKGVQALISKSPILANQLGAFGDLLATGLTGATVGGFEEATKEGKFKMPSADDLLEHGAIWGAIDLAVKGAGKAVQFGKSLLNAARVTGESETKILKELTSRIGNVGQKDEEIAQKAIDVLDQMAAQKSTKELKIPEKEIGKTEALAKEKFDKDLTNRVTDLKTKKVSPQEFDKLENLPAESYLPAEFEAEKIVEDTIDSEVKQAIEDIAPRAESESELGRNIIKDIENTNSQAEKTYNEFYEKSKKGMVNKFPKLENTVTQLVKEIQRIDQFDLKTAPEGYSKVRKQLMNFLEDLGYTMTNDAWNVQQAVQGKKINLSQAIELKKRANKLINYDLKESGAQDFLERVVDKLRGDIVNGFGKEGNKARESFQKAEKLFGENAERMNRKAVKGSRFTEKPESIARQIRTPSGFADIKAVSSPTQIAQMERELLENMNKMTEDRARSFFREMRSQLSRDAQNVAERIIESKIPSSVPGKKQLQRQKLQDMVIDDLSRATITGERPDKALNLWKTDEGQKLIKASLEGNPNKKEVIKYLSDQSLSDFSKSILNSEGKIDFKKLNSFLNDKATIENIRLTAGQDGVDFLKQLETLSNRVNRNFNIIEGKIDKGSAKARKEVETAFRQKGNEKIQRSKEKRAEPTKEQNIANEKISPKTAKGRKELEQLAKSRGEVRLGKIKEERSKNDLFRKFDDFIDSFGTTSKTLMGMFGILKLSSPQIIGAGIGYKILKSAIKNPNFRTAYRRAASSKAESPIVLLNAMEKINESVEE